LFSIPTKEEKDADSDSHEVKAEKTKPAKRIPPGPVEKVESAEEIGKDIDRIIEENKTVLGDTAEIAQAYRDAHPANIDKLKGCRQRLLDVLKGPNGNAELF
jgi:hypothetical protein